MIDFDTLVIGPNMTIFGEAVVYSPQSGGSIPITGVFQEAYRALVPLGGSMGREPIEIGMQGDTNSVGPALGVQISQFLVVPLQDDTLFVRGNSYVVREVRPDGVGAAHLLLQDYAA